MDGQVKSTEQPKTSSESSSYIYFIIKAKFGSSVFVPRWFLETCQKQKTIILLPCEERRHLFQPSSIPCEPLTAWNGTHEFTEWDSTWHHHEFNFLKVSLVSIFWIRLHFGLINYKNYIMNNCHIKPQGDWFLYWKCLMVFLRNSIMRVIFCQELKRFTVEKTLLGPDIWRLLKM